MNTNLEYIKTNILVWISKILNLMPTVNADTHVTLTYLDPRNIFSMFKIIFFDNYNLALDNWHFFFLLLFVILVYGSKPIILMADRSSNNRSKPIAGPSNYASGGSSAGAPGGNGDDNGKGKKRKRVEEDVVEYSETQKKVRGEVAKQDGQLEHGVDKPNYANRDQIKGISVSVGNGENINLYDATCNGEGETIATALDYEFKDTKEVSHKHFLGAFKEYRSVNRVHRELWGAYKWNNRSPGFNYQKIIQYKDYIRNLPRK